MRTLFAGRRGDQYIIFRDEGSTDPPWGASVTKKLLDTWHLKINLQSTFVIPTSNNIGDMLETLVGLF